MKLSKKSSKPYTKRKKHYRASRSATVNESLIEFLRQQDPQFAALDYDEQFGVASLVWDAPMPSRRHNTEPEAMTIGHLEFEGRFGRKRFEDINAALDLFEVGEEYAGKSTRSYKLTPRWKALRDEYSCPDKDHSTRLLYQTDAGIKTMHALPPAISSERPVVAWQGRDITAAVPVNMEQLFRLDEILSEQLMSDPASERINYMRERTREIIRLAQSDIAPGHMPHQYAEYESGRLYALRFSLQTAPREVRTHALHGMFDHDLSNAHFTIFHQYCQRYDFEASAVGHYLIHKRAVRQGISERVGLSIDDTKECLLALLYGAPASTRKENAIPALIGQQRARILFADPQFKALSADVKHGQKLILKKWPVIRGRILNAAGKYLPATEKAKTRLSHILTGAEVAAIVAAIGTLDQPVILMMHDGFVTRNPIDLEAAESQIFAETGFKVSLESEAVYAE